MENYAKFALKEYNQCSHKLTIHTSEVTWTENNHETELINNYWLASGISK